MFRCVHFVALKPECLDHLNLLFDEPNHLCRTLWSGEDPERKVMDLRELRWEHSQALDVYVSSGEDARNGGQKTYLVLRVN